MRLMGYRLLSAPLIFAFLASGLSQTSSKSGIKGTVTDREGSLIPDAVIVVKDSSGKMRECKTNINGDYEILLALGFYTINFKSRPLKTFEVENYYVRSSGLMRFDVSLFCENCEEVSLR